MKHFLNRYCWNKQNGHKWWKCQIKNIFHNQFYCFLFLFLIKQTLQYFWIPQNFKNKIKIQICSTLFNSRNLCTNFVLVLNIKLDNLVKNCKNVCQPYAAMHKFCACLGTFLTKFGFLSRSCYRKFTDILWN